MITLPLGGLKLSASCFVISISVEYYFFVLCYYNCFDIERCYTAIVAQLS